MSTDYGLATIRDGRKKNSVTNYPYEITRISVTCGGIDLCKKIINGLISGSINEANDILKDAHKFGCSSCLIIDNIGNPSHRFSPPGEAYTKPETITVDFADRKIELYYQALVCPELWQPKKRNDRLPIGILFEKGWEIFFVNLPDLSDNAQEKAWQIGARWK